MFAIFFAHCMIIDTSEDICNEYAAQTMFCQGQDFPTEKKTEKARFCLAFFILAQCGKKGQNFKTLPIAFYICDASSTFTRQAGADPEG